MIRRSTSSGWNLIAQHDHALLSGRLAQHLGNNLFEAPAPLDRFVEAVSLHDCGWPVHDDSPTLNPAGQPIDVFESTSQIALKVWSASVDRAMPRGDDVALLVSLHALSLSVNASSTTPQKHEHFEMNHPAVRFEINKFQHRQVELQEQFRKRLGLRTDAPLRHGLAEESKDPAEQELAYRFRLLQALDQLSLAACCTQPPSNQIKPVLARPGGRALALRIQRPEDQTVQVSPWPFRVERIVEQVPCRVMPATAFTDQPAFAVAYGAASAQSMPVTFIPGR